MHCARCGFQTTRQRDWTRHLSSQSHIANAKYMCECDNAYSSKSNLRRHQITCRLTSQRDTRLVEELRERDAILVNELRLRDARQQELFAIRDAELSRQMAERDRAHAIEMAALRSEIASNPTTTFNLNFFLNDTCKSALSMQQFVEGIALDMETDQSIDDYFIQSLQRETMENRPIHCIDFKRGKMVIKNADAWERDPVKVDPLVMQSLNTLRGRYNQKLGIWTDANPGHLTDDKLNDIWLRLLMFIHADVHEKFFSRVAKATAIDKS